MSASTFLTKNLSQSEFKSFEKNFTKYVKNQKEIMDLDQKIETLEIKEKMQKKELDAAKRDYEQALKEQQIAEENHKQSQFKLKWSTVDLFCKTLMITPPLITEVDLVNKLSAKYLSNNELTFKGGATILKMSPFVKYLKDHPETTGCNFSGFRIVNDTETLAKFFKGSKHKVTAIAFDANLKDSINAAFKKVFGKNKLPIEIVFLEIKKPSQNSVTSNKVDTPSQPDSFSESHSTSSDEEISPPNSPSNSPKKSVAKDKDVAELENIFGDLLKPSYDKEEELKAIKEKAKNLFDKVIFIDDEPALPWFEKYLLNNPSATKEDVKNYLKLLRSQGHKIQW